MSLAHGEGEEEIQGTQWLRSCRKPNFVCEALERSWGEAECWLIQGYIREYKYYAACVIYVGLRVKNDSNYLGADLFCSVDMQRYLPFSFYCKKNSIHGEKQFRDVNIHQKKKKERKLAGHWKCSAEFPPVS